MAMQTQSPANAATTSHGNDTSQCARFMRRFQASQGGFWRDRKAEYRGLAAELVARSCYKHDDEALMHSSP